MNRAEKIKRTEVLKDEFDKASAIFIADYRGIEVNQLTELRKELNKCETKFAIVKNRLALRALSEKHKGIEEHFDYTTAVALNFGDVASAAKALTNFAKDNEQLKFKGGWVEGKTVSLAELKALATLPSREELLASLMGTLLNVPGGFVRVLNGVPSKFVYLLAALKDKKQQEENNG